MDFNITKGKFDINEARQLNPLVLAFIGDAVYEAFIRMYLVDQNREALVHKLHKEAVSFVKAHSQSEFAKQIIHSLTEDELVMYKRGRNTKSAAPKNADVQEYRAATGFETVIGYLYVTEQTERLNEVLEQVISIRSSIY